MPGRRYVWILVLGAATAMGATPAARADDTPKLEHFAFCRAGYMTLDGPRFEAMMPGGRPGPGMSDDKGNVWFINRCVVKDSGTIMPFFGDDYWNGHLGATEGPGSAFDMHLQVRGQHQPAGFYFVWGDTMAGGDRGYHLFCDRASVTRVWKNPEKDNRWWFERIAGRGGTPVPKTRGGSVPALDARLNTRMVQVTPEGMMTVFADGGFYEIADGTLKCLLGFDDYKADLPKEGGTVPAPSMGVIGGDGSFYLGTYFTTGAAGSPSVWRVPPGKTKAEPIVWCHSGTPTDGPGLDAGFHCGPHFWYTKHNYKYLPPNAIFFNCHDEQNIRRWMNGRMSSLCTDGTFREMGKGTDDKGTEWAHGWNPGPGNIATVSTRALSKSVTSIVTGLDLGAETVGPLRKGVERVWPPEKGTGKEDDEK